MDEDFTFTDAWLADLTLKGGSTKMKTVKDELLDVVYIVYISSTKLGYLDFRSLISQVLELQPVM